MRPWYAQRQNLLALRMHSDAPIMQLRQIDSDPQLTDAMKERMSAPLREQIAKARDPLFASAESIKKAALKNFIANQPHNLRRRGFTQDPERVTRVLQAGEKLPPNELLWHAQQAIEDGDDATRYGLELVLRQRDDIDRLTQGEIFKALDKPYEDEYNEAVTNLVISRQEYAKMRLEVDPGTAATLTAAHEAYEVPERDGKGVITLTEEVIDACYARASVSRSA